MHVNPCVCVSVHVCSCEYTGAGMTWFLVQTFGGAIPPCPVSTPGCLQSLLLLTAVRPPIGHLWK